MKKMDTHSMILSFFFATLQTLHSPKGKKKKNKKKITKNMENIKTDILFTNVIPQDYSRKQGTRSCCTPSPQFFTHILKKRNLVIRQVISERLNFCIWLRLDLK